MRFIDIDGMRADVFMAESGDNVAEPTSNIFNTEDEDNITITDPAQIAALIYKINAASIKNAQNGIDKNKKKKNNNKQESKSSENHWYEFFNDHHPGGDLLYQFNKYFNPIAGVVNLFDTYTTGKDSYGESESKGDATANLAMMIPIFRAGEVINFLGNTGRIVAKNLFEELAMKEILEDPSRGRVIIQSINDARWSGWSKMQFTNTSINGTKVVIHYVALFQNGVMVAVDDFKFVNN